MKSENAIEVRDVEKSFKIFIDKGNTIKERALFRNRRKYEYRQVLRGISFDVKKGEAIGLIGHNGCGKSTTLKLLTKIIYPDKGSIEIQGRVSSLIELGAGFHPDLSGRENIYINASIFGLGRKEIDRRLNDIIAFSELEEFIDNPVRTYSSGMYMRLAFSVAINVDADVLLIDEILAVGDANFQAKCFNKLREIKAAGTTIVIVSHSLGQIEQICERSIWIHDGGIRKEGTPREVHPVYLDYMGQKRQEIAETQKSRSERDKKQADVEAEIKNSEEPHEKDIGNFFVKICDVQLIDENHIPTTVYNIGSKMGIVVKYERRNKDVLESEFGFHIFRNDGVDCYGTNTVIDKVRKVQLNDQGEVAVFFEHLNLLQGKYKVDIAFHDEYGLTYNHRYEAAVFEVVNLYDEVGVVRLEHKWVLNEKEL